MKNFFFILSSLFVLVSCNSNNSDIKIEEYNSSPEINSNNLPQYDQ